MRVLGGPSCAVHDPPRARDATAIEVEYRGERLPATAQRCPACGDEWMTDAETLRVEELLASLALIHPLAHDAGWNESNGPLVRVVR